ncbi:MAG: carboxylating nicotinate-nucleotide diphosphorylase [Thiovulaceae bacterium]|nr:carboxylating nicotinate-nucleotide diphosphorylase [Sulfurimonadaceae bacterium]
MLETLAEDVGRGDLYAKVLPSTKQDGYLVAKSDAVLAGVVYVNELALLEAFEIKWQKQEGEAYQKGDILATFSGNSHTLLKIERTMLNILHHASGIATLTRKYVDLINPYGVMLLDTRKTRPKLRIFEKYASVVGGATNHRMGLDDALMLKDTHLKTIKDLNSYISKARKKIPFTTTIEVECEDYEMAKRAMQADADIIMCDNMTPGEITEVVRLRNESHPKVRLEASGNISLETVELYAQTGVDAISTGSTIHQAVWPDISMKIN